MHCGFMSASWSDHGMQQQCYYQQELSGYTITFPTLLQRILKCHNILYMHILNSDLQQLIYIAFNYNVMCTGDKPYRVHAWCMGILYSSRGFNITLYQAKLCSKEVIQKDSIWIIFLPQDGKPIKFGIPFLKLLWLSRKILPPVNVATKLPGCFIYRIKVCIHSIHWTIDRECDCTCSIFHSIGRTEIIVITTDKANLEMQWVVLSWFQYGKLVADIFFIRWWEWWSYKYYLSWFQVPCASMHIYSACIYSNTHTHTHTHTHNQFRMYVHVHTSVM